MVAFAVTVLVIVVPVVVPPPLVIKVSAFQCSAAVLTFAPLCCHCGHSVLPVPLWWHCDATVVTVVGTVVNVVMSLW